jgi:hypothetical protein
MKLTGRVPRLLAGVGVLLATGIAVAPAHAAPLSAKIPTSTTFISVDPVRSSTHIKLVATITATRLEYHAPHKLTALLVKLSTPTGTEAHTWSFALPTSAFTNTSRRTGAVSVTSATMGPYGSLKLTFRPSGKPVTKKCDAANSTTTSKLTVSGTLWFVTKSTGAHRWGDIGSKHKAFRFATTSDLVTNLGGGIAECAPPGQTTCAIGTTWEALSADQLISMSGATPILEKPELITATRTVNLAKPKHATRLDLVTDTGPGIQPDFMGGSPDATLVVSGGGSSSGSATMTGTQDGAPFTHVCPKAGSETITTWLADFVNDAPPLSISGAIFGAIRMPNTTKDIDEFTYQGGSQ